MADLEKIKWCKARKNGIELINPNDNLANEYIDNAEETLVILKTIKGKSNMWIAATKYYFEYFAVYSVLMKLGIKSEIHDCTISLCGFLEDEGIFKKGVFARLTKDKVLRIKNQYYLKNMPVDVDNDELLEFLLEIKDTLEKMTYEQIRSIRSRIKKI
ncbi:MAG: hypothetical protein U9Q92_00055 [archaeon]|nr:hypothetical protein [archaeon]